MSFAVSNNDYNINLSINLRDYAGPKFSGDIMSPSRRFRAMFLQTERQQTACSSRPYPPNKARFPM